MPTEDSVFKRVELRPSPKLSIKPMAVGSSDDEKIPMGNLGSENIAFNSTVSVPHKSDPASVVNPRPENVVALQLVKVPPSNKPPKLLEHYTVVKFWSQSEAVLRKVLLKILYAIRAIVQCISHLKWEQTERH